MLSERLLAPTRCGTAAALLLLAITPEEVEVPRCDSVKVCVKRGDW